MDHSGTPWIARRHVQEEQHRGSKSAKDQKVLRDEADAVDEDDGSRNQGAEAPADSSASSGADCVQKQQREDQPRDRSSLLPQTSSSPSRSGDQRSIRWAGVTGHSVSRRRKEQSMQPQQQEVRLKAAAGKSTADSASRPSFASSTSTSSSSCRQPRSQSQPRQQQQARTAGKGIARLERVKEGEERGLTVAEGREEREGEREAD